MIIGLFINGGCTALLGKWAITAFKNRTPAFGWICVVGSAWNLALVMLFVSNTL